MPERLELPLVRQTLDYTCGAACFDSMFRYFNGWSPGELHFARELGTLELGYTPPERIASLARNYGFRSQFSEGTRLEDLRAAFEGRAVVFVTWWDEDAGHYSLVKALDDDHIELMDPWMERETQDHRLPLQAFIPNWLARGAKIIEVSR